jgi:RNA-directed DNA polymerase
MTTAFAVGAASHEPRNWHAVNWRAATGNVRRLQVRIAKAVKEGRWGKVQALQRLLTSSLSGKLLAVRRVTENQGKTTPGVDGIVWDTPGRKMEAVHALKRRGYRPRPLRRVYIPKSNGKPRPLGIPTMRDRAMQALHLLALDPVAETTADRNSYGFRKRRSCADAIEACFINLTRPNPSWILEGDIRGCFDNINHEWLLAHVPMDKVILRKWLASGYMEKHVLHATERGTPQGGIISPVLANLALDGLERRLREAYPIRGRGSERGRRACVHLVRYADDFIITGRSEGLLANEVKPLVGTFLRDRGLALSAEKTRITRLADGFDFLGQNIRRYSNGKLLIKPSRKSIKAFLREIRGIVRSSAAMTVGRLIGRLNPVIRGWANYHRHVVSKRIFSRVDGAIFQSLWQWARRRHPRRGRRWVARRYFARRDSRGWCLFGIVMGPDGRQRRVWLHHATATPIRRHIKIRGDANPYDPAWEPYLEARESAAMAQALRGRGALLHLWRRQDGTCTVCDQKITRETGWHCHHVVPRAMGGPDGAPNLVLLHPECHRQVHGRTPLPQGRVSREAFRRLEPRELETLMRGS